MLKIIRTGILLGLICFVSAFCLARVYQKTKDKIEGQSQASVFLKSLFPRGKKFVKKSINQQDYFLVYGEKQNCLGVVVPVTTIGYSGEIKLLTALDPNGKILTFQVLKHNETPGLGAKITEPDFIEQFQGKSRRDLILTKDDPRKGKIEAITAATISSRAALEGIKKAVGFFRNNIRPRLESTESRKQKETIENREDNRYK